MRYGVASQQGGAHARQRRFVVHDRIGHAYDKCILSRQTFYNDKKKKKKKKRDSLGLGRHKSMFHDFIHPQHICSRLQLADIFTKALAAPPQYHFLLSNLGLLDLHQPPI